MFEAQLLMVESTVFSPWFPRGGDGVRATLDVVKISGATIKVELFTKNSEDTGDGDNADTTAGTKQNISRSSVGRTTEEWSQAAVAGIGSKSSFATSSQLPVSPGTGFCFACFRRFGSTRLRPLDVLSPPLRGGLWCRRESTFGAGSECGRPGGHLGGRGAFTYDGAWPAGWHGPAAGLTPRRQVDGWIRDSRIPTLRS